MKLTIKSLIILVLIFVFSACNKDDDSPNLGAVTSKTAINIPAPQTGGQGQPVGGAFTKFSFEKGAITTSETNWDIAFRGTTIAINGGTITGANDEPERNGNAGVYIASGTFSSVTDASSYTFKQDATASYAIPTGSDNGWYNYAGPPTHVISPIPGRILVIKTHNGKYAKVELLSYYKDAPTKPEVSSESKFYTFNYVYNPNEGETLLE